MSDRTATMVVFRVRGPHTTAGYYEVERRVTTEMIRDAFLPIWPRFFAALAYDVLDVYTDATLSDLRWDARCERPRLVDDYWKTGGPL